MSCLNTFALHTTCLPSWPWTSSNRYLELHNEKLSWLRFHHRQWKDPGPRDRGIFHVKSLFTNVPIEGTVQAVLRKLGNDADQADSTTLTLVLIADLLDFSLHEICVLPVQRIDLRTMRRRRLTEPCILYPCYCWSLHGDIWRTSDRVLTKIWKRYEDDTLIHMYKYRI